VLRRTRPAPPSRSTTPLPIGARVNDHVAADLDAWPDPHTFPE
jgi:hypothetical protein